MKNLHARLWNTQYLSTQPQSYQGVCNLKEVNETTGRGARACMKQQVLLNKDRYPHKCELGKSATYPNLIYSLPPSLEVHIPPPWQPCVILYDRRNAPPHVVCKHAYSLCVCNNPLMWYGPLWTTTAPQLLEQECKLTEPCSMAAPLWAALNAHPPVLAFPLLSSFNKIFCLCWMSGTQLSHIRQREMGGGGARSGKKKSRKRTASYRWWYWGNVYL